MRLSSFPELRTVWGIPYTRQHIYRLVRAGKFPAPIKLGDGPGASNAWPNAELEQYLADRIAARDTRIAAEATKRQSPISTTTERVRMRV